MESKIDGMSPNIQFPIACTNPFCGLSRKAAFPQALGSLFDLLVVYDGLISAPGLDSVIPNIAQISLSPWGEEKIAQDLGLVFV